MAPVLAWPQQQKIPCQRRRKRKSHRSSFFSFQRPEARGGRVPLASCRASTLLVTTCSYCSGCGSSLLRATGNKVLVSCSSCRRDKLEMYTHLPQGIHPPLLTTPRTPQLECCCSSSHSFWTASCHLSIAAVTQGPMFTRGVYVVEYASITHTKQTCVDKIMVGSRVF